MQLDPNVAQLKDPRIRQLLSGKGSLQLLSRTLRYPDWLVVSGQTMTAIPQYQYATLLPASGTVLSDKMFQDCLVDDELHARMSEQDKSKILRIKQALDICPVCKRGAYKAQACQILTRYVQLPDTQVHTPEYPDTTVQLPPVFIDQTRPYKDTKARTACYDCIQKHIGQASITAMEARLGYPEHILLCYGHLAQAIQECPEDAVHLKALITLCLGVSKAHRQGFVPLPLLCAAIQQTREQDQGSVATVANVQDSRYTLQHGITADFLANMSDTDKDKLYSRIKVFNSICAQLCRFSATDTQAYSAARIQWIGILACIAQLLAAYNIETANAIRNIRLLFYAAPELISAAPQYNLSDIMALLEQQRANQEAVSNLPDTSASDPSGETETR